MAAPRSWWRVHFRRRQLDVPLDEALARFLESYDRRLTNHTRPYPGIPEMLEELGSEGVKMSLLTNKPLGASERILEAFGLARFFPLRVGGDGPWPRKPAPEGLRFLMKEESAEPSQTRCWWETRASTWPPRATRACASAWRATDLDSPMLPPRR